MQDQEKGGDRRDFLKAAGAVAATGAYVGNLSALGGAMPQAANTSGKEEIKIALIGCGGRGSGAAENALTADTRVKLVAAADLFSDRLNGSLYNLNQKFKDRANVPGDHRFIGFDAFEKVMSVPTDYVILATPPHFRPYHFEAAIKAKKNVFMEKPVAVDPVGIRKVLAAGEEAKKLGLSVVAGTQRRHQKSYLITAEEIREGKYGKILSGQIYWNQNQLWHRDRGEGWSDMEWMIRDWVNWCWLSGDHICEQHVHNIDVANWFIGAHPVKAIGMGGHAHRPTGDQYDYFAVDFEYPGDVHVASYARQINDTKYEVSERFAFEKGIVKGGQGMQGRAPQGGGKNKSRPARNSSNDPYVVEHADLIASIVDGKKLNEAQNVAYSTLTAIMGRVAAYTGKEVTWDEIMESNLRLGPTEYNFDVKLFPTKRPVPGRA